MKITVDLENGSAVQEFTVDVSSLSPVGDQTVVLKEGESVEVEAAPAETAPEQAAQ